ncbi:hypothetical protein Btru_057332 [Bulinus truncatus]|nr:hypothetical protein Btru_057332 [Bulinus truncatus]
MCQRDEPELSPLELSSKIREDQGLHEADVSCGGEADLKVIFRNCPKNPGHAGFIPASQFGACHLPPDYRHSAFVECVKAVSEFSVRILVRHTSKNRPELYPGTQEPYPFSHYKGTDHLRLGSGWVDGVGMKFLPEHQRRCPCHQCRTSDEPSYTWGQFWVHTALHVVYNRDEAQHAECQLFYGGVEEEEGSPPHARVYALDGVEIVGSCAEDTCSVRCVTHDVGLVDLFNAMWSRLHRLQETVLATMPDSGQLEKLCIVVSHPHGCGKQISIGKWTHRQSHGDDWTQYYYTTDTCPGSSGAPVYLLGKEKGLTLSTNHPHSARCEEPGLNTSGIWWEKF